MISSGHSTLATTCPVCEHSPISATDCKPHKSLRTTVKVFLRTEEKKREAARLKEAKKVTPPQTPAHVVTPAEVSDVKTEESAIEASTTEPAKEQTEAQTKAPTDLEPSTEQIESQKEPLNGKDIPSEADHDVPQPSIEVCQLYRVRPDIN